jgi:hydrogenase maturation protease
VKRVLIGGVGSVLLGDDGVGPYAVHLLESRYEFSDEVAVEDLGTPGLDLVAYLTGIKALILIDSVDNGKAPGSMTIYRKADILKVRPAVRMDPHAPSLTESLFVAELAGDAPDDVMLIGITGKEYGDTPGLSPAVKAAVDEAITEVLSEVERLGESYTKKVTPSDPGLWWTAEVALV